MAVSYLQISKAKGDKVLELLESARKSYKSQGSGKTAINTLNAVPPSTVKHAMDLTASSRKLEKHHSHIDQSSGGNE